MNVKKYKETEAKIMTFATSMKTIEGAREQDQVFYDATSRDKEELLAALKTVTLYYNKNAILLDMVGLDKAIKAIIMTLEWVMNADTLCSNTLESLLEMWLNDLAKTADEAIKIQNSTLTKQ